MVGNRRGWSGRRGEQGSSLIYVILSITLLSVFSCGYMAVSRYQMKSALTGKSYMEAQITAKTIHSTFCGAVASGKSEAANSIWRCFEEDSHMVREEYDEMMDDEEAGEDGEEGEEEIPAEAMEGYGTGYGFNGHGRDTEPKSRWERYLHHAL